ncbi:MAG: hypothetical protein RBU30_19410, partial [Polyangia bacterium]|nr:hypothetical protein [Polyangia bacterium]
MNTRLSPRLLASLLTTALGVSLAVGRCVAPPGGVPKKDAGPRKKDAAMEEAPDPAAEALRKARLDRLTSLAGAKRVQVVSLAGPLDEAAAQGLARDLRGVADDEAVVLELDSVGGVPGAVEKVRDSLGAFKGPLVVFVRGQALGEAALLPFAAQVVVLAPGARWGAASQTQFSARRMSDGELAALAETFREAARIAGRPEDWARAMVIAPAPPRAGQGTAAAGVAQEKTPAMQGGDGADAGASSIPGPEKSSPSPDPYISSMAAADAKAKKPSPPPVGALVTLGAREAVRLGLGDFDRSDLQSLVHRLGWAGKEVLRSGKAVQIPKAPVDGVKPKKDPEAILNGTRRILVIPVSGTIELGLSSFVLRVLQKAKAGDLVVLDIDTFGGRVDAATQIRDGLLRTKAKTVALINPRAISAGALISLACDLIVMVPGGSIGAATPVQVGGGGEAQPVGEKVVSYLRKEFKATAEAKGRRGDLAEAMVDMSVEVEDVPAELKATISGLQKGKLLTLTTEEAMALHMAELRAESFEDFVEKSKLGHVPVIRQKVNWAEEVSRFL